MTTTAAAGAEPSDDEIDAAELLWRRVHVDHYVPDGAGGMKVSTAAFSDEEMSVDRQALVVAEGHDHRFTQQDGAGVAEFAAKLAIEVHQAVLARPITGNTAHAEVRGLKPRSVLKQFVKGSRFIS